jgi:hypothetical protein
LNRIRLTWLRFCLVAKKSEENLEVIREMNGLIVSCFWEYLTSEMKGSHSTKYLLFFFVFFWVSFDVFISIANLGLD